VSGLGAAIAQQGHRLIFLNVLLQQIGVPMPAEPTLVVAGSLAVRGRLSVAGIAVAALVATMLADLTWFAIGKRYGRRAIRLVFRLSSSPDEHLSRTERLHSRWGPAAFALAKFIPGLPMAGPILAGGLGTTLPVFLLYDLLAMSVWAGTFTLLGAIFEHDVERALRALDRFSVWGLCLLAVVLAGVILWRWKKIRAALAQQRSSNPRPPVMAERGGSSVYEVDAALVAATLERRAEPLVENRE
jgi:membrane protein DedA with SNARE-associated domain